MKFLKKSHTYIRSSQPSVEHSEGLWYLSAYLMSLASMVELHRLMLKDNVRNAAYARAISHIVKSGDVVLDLGAGTGFLAMLAARAGARKVLAVEAADVADLGKRLCQDNGLAQKVTWHAIPSMDLQLKASERADVLVTETFGSHPFEECAHEFVRDARQRLCKANARIVPSHVEVFAAPAELIAQRNEWDLFGTPIAGLDFSRLRKVTMGSMYSERVSTSALLAPGALLERVELGGPAHSRRSMQGSWLAARAGQVSALVQWFRLELAPDVALDTGSMDTHWRQIVYPLPTPFNVKAGDAIEATVKLDTRLQVDLSVQWNVQLRANR
jgi:predicted RNA methylase